MEQTVKRNMKRTARRIVIVAVILFFAIVTLTTVTPQDYLNDPTLGVVETPHDEYNAVQLPAETGEPVEWVKQVTVTNLYDQAITEVMVSVPQQAGEIKVVDEENKDIVVTQNGEDVVIVDNLGFNEEKSYIVKYETPAPELQETALSREGDSFKKQVIISSEFHYQDVLTKASLPEISEEEKEKVRLFWDLGGQKTDVTADPEFNIMFYDTDADGRYDLMTWVTPHLSTQIFEIIIYTDVDPGSYTNIGIALHGPSDGEYIQSTNRVGFNYTVSYNASTFVFCNLTVDGQVLEENIQTMTDNSLARYHNLSSGQHSWSVSCAGTDGRHNTSSTRTFTIDIDAPSVALNTADYIVSHTNGIDLQFTATDSKDATLTCALSVKGPVNRTGIAATNNTLTTVSLTGLSNGVYDWNVSCADSAGNRGPSEERVFYISQGTPSEYNISTNKQTYAMGEMGYLVIDAPSKTNLTLFVSKPLQDSFFEYYIGQNFPIIDTINYTSNSGTYNLDGIFTHAGEMYIVKTSFEVSNSFRTYIEANKTTGRPGTEFEFEASSSGGIGAVTYSWDFDDDATALGEDAEHTFTTIGDYMVELTATDSKGNKATDTVEIHVYNIYNVTVIVKEKQTGKLLENISVEVDDERKKTDSAGVAQFEVYEGKRRIYIAHEEYEWFKLVKNISSHQTIIAELNYTGPVTEGGVSGGTAADAADGSNVSSEEIQESVKGTISEAEVLLAKVESALESLVGMDQAGKSVIEVLDVEGQLQMAKKKLRQVIRDIGKVETDKSLSNDEKGEKIANFTSSLKEYNSLVSDVEVLDTTEFVDYPKIADVKMVAAEYLAYKKLDYSKGEKEDYAELIDGMQKEITIKSRLSVVKISLLSGTEKTISVVTNTLTTKPEETEDRFLLEYVPKEVADSSGKIVKIDDFEIVKSDPILRFDLGMDRYSYYVDGDTTIDNLKKTKHILMQEPEGQSKGLPAVTGMSILPSLEIENPKLFLEILLIILLVIAYLVYHFEVPDRIREWRKNKKANFKPYEIDMAYQPESTIETFTRKAKEFVNKEDEVIRNELHHLRNMISSAHYHAKNKDHKKAHETYAHVQDAYKRLSKDAKAAVHPETKELYHTVTLTKIHHLLDEAFLHLDSNEHKKAKSHYSEIKQLYAKLETRHRAAVGERCMQLHQRLFETSLT